MMSRGRNRIWGRPQWERAMERNLGERFPLRSSDTDWDRTEQPVRAPGSLGSTSPPALHKKRGPQRPGGKQRCLLVLERGKARGRKCGERGRGGEKEGGRKLPGGKEENKQQTAARQHGHPSRRPPTFWCLRSFSMRSILSRRSRSSSRRSSSISGLMWLRLTSTSRISSTRTTLGIRRAMASQPCWSITRSNSCPTAEAMSYTSITVSSAAFFSRAVGSPPPPPSMALPTPRRPHRRRRSARLSSASRSPGRAWRYGTARRCAARRGRGSARLGQTRGAGVSTWPGGGKGAAAAAGKESAAAPLRLPPSLRRSGPMARTGRAGGGAAHAHCRRALRAAVLCRAGAGGGGMLAPALAIAGCGLDFQDFYLRG